MPDDPKKPAENNEPNSAPASIKIGEQTFTAEQVEALAAKAQSADQVTEFAQRLGMDVESFIRNSEQAFSVVLDLQKQGILQNDGTIKLPQAEPKQERDLFSKSKDSDPAAAALSQISKTLEDINKRVETVETGQARLYENEINQIVKAAFPNLDDEDLNIIKREALRRNKPVLEVAKARNESRSKSRAEIEEEVKSAIAKKYGIDFEALNNQPDFGPDGPTPAAFTQGKKLSLRGGGDTVKVGDAVEAFFRAKGAMK